MDADDQSAIVDHGSSFYSDLADKIPGMDLGSFLSRPVNIKTISWDTSTSSFLLGNFDPWTLYLSNARILPKIQNFAYLRANLHLKFVVSASPFMYGSAIAAYCPLPKFKNKIANISAFSNVDCISLSQRPHIWLYPQNSVGGDLICPFFFPRQFVDITSAAEVASLGEVDVCALVPVESANAVSTTEKVTIQVYAWLDDVELHGPTMGAALQVGTTIDEYDGPISGTASAVAKAAGTLTDVPGIGSLATAAQIGASAVAKISSLFGYSNTPIIDDAMPFKPSPFPSLASPEISYPIEKLTLDPKNELSIDPKIVGLDNVDELSMKHMLTKESLIDMLSVNMTATPDYLMWCARVNPAHYYADPYKALPVSGGDSAVATRVIPTPQAWLAPLFDYWRGDIIYRFVFVCTKYHKGKVRISWDPRGNAAGNLVDTADTSTVVKTAVVDISDTTEFEMRIPYSQATKFLKLPKLNTTTNNPLQSCMDNAYPVSSFVFNQRVDTDNGFLTMRLFNKITCPSDTGDIKVMIFARGAENLEYAAPRNINDLSQDYNVTQFQVSSYFPPQAGVEIFGEHEIVSDDEIKSSDKAVYLESMGENITNLRQIMRRFALYWTTAVALNTVNSLRITRINIPRVPGVPGYSGSTLGSVVKLSGHGGTYGYSHCHTTAVAWIVEAFIGIRGSMNWIHNPVQPNFPKGHVRAYRNAFASAATPIGTNISTKTITSLTPFDHSFQMMKFTRGGSSGSALTSQHTNSGLAVTVPMYSPYLFESTDRYKAWGYVNAPLVPSPSDDTNDKFTTFEVADNSINVSSASVENHHFYTAIGSDFTCHFFLNAPTYYIYYDMPNGA